MKPVFSHFPQLHLNFINTEISQDAKYASDARHALFNVPVKLKIIFFTPI